MIELYFYFQLFVKKINGKQQLHLNYLDIACSLAAVIFFLKKTGRKKKDVVEGQSYLAIGRSALAQLCFSPFLSAETACPSQRASNEIQNRVCEFT